eukprot:gene19596-biopygen2511
MAGVGGGTRPLDSAQLLDGCGGGGGGKVAEGGSRPSGFVDTRGLLHKFARERPMPSPNTETSFAARARVAVCRE